MNLFNNLKPVRSEGPANGEGGVTDEPVIQPVYRVQETEEAFGLTVHLPGVGREGLEFTADDNELRIRGRRGWAQPEGWTQIHRETPGEPYELVLAHDHAIALDRIHAELTDGVLRVSLPKAEALKPRKIAIA